MIFIENKKIHKAILLLFLLTTYLIFLFKPYYFVTFDSEPDYLANAIHIIDWGIPWGGHHPGTLIQYLYSWILKILIFFKINLQTTIIIIRLIYFLIFALIIYLSSRFILKSKKLFFFIISLTIILPLTNFHFSHFGVELILFSLSFLLWSIFYRQVYFNEFSKNTLLVSIILGITISIKFSSIILLPIYFFIILFFVDENLKNKISLIFNTSLISLLVFIISTIPSVRYYPKLFNKINRQINIETLSHNEIIFLLISLFLIISAMILILFFYNKKITTLIIKKKKLVITTFFFIVTILLLKSFIENLNIKDNEVIESYFQIPSLWRNYIPILPFYFFLILHNKRILNFYTIISFSIINIILCYSHFYNKKSYVDELILNEKKKKIIFFTDTKFNSKFNFLEYSKNRFGNNKIKYPQYWIEDSSSDLLSNDIYKNWFFNWVDVKKNNFQTGSSIGKINIKRKKDINLRDNIRKKFKSQNYEIEKFKKISLIKPTYNSRVIFDHCNYFLNSKIIFDLNYTDKKNVIFFESTIEDVESFCKVNMIIKIIKNNIVIYEFK